ncbi:MAG: hypothetical protein ABIE68_05020 [bacterium]
MNALIPGFFVIVAFIVAAYIHKNSEWLIISYFVTGAVGYVLDYLLQSFLENQLSNYTLFSPNSVDFTVMYAVLFVIPLVVIFRNKLMRS